MMHDPVTNTPPPSTNFYAHKPEEIMTNNQTKLNMNSRDMLSVAAGSRRPNSVGLGKTERPAKTAAGVNGAGRWRINSSGQLVDSVSAEWDIADEISKLQLGDNASDPKSQMRSPPQMRGSHGAMGIESSPLESSSDSLGSDSPNAFEQANLTSHSRGASVDTNGSQTSQTLHAAPYTPAKNASLNESRNRPHSYSGGLSSADLVRLQQAGGSPGLPETWTSTNGTPERPAATEQPQYPSLVSQSGLSRGQEEFQGDHQGQQRMFNPFPQSQLAGVGHYQNNRPNTTMHGPQLRGRGAFPPPVQAVAQTPPNYAFPAPLHPATLPVGGGQQIYDMMLPTPPLDNPAMARLQQQSPYRSGHQHSASDPASLRDPAMLALLNSNMQAAFAAGQMYGPSAMVPPTLALFNQFYGAPDAYGSPDLSMMARLQPQFTGQYGIPSAQSASLGGLSAAAQSSANAAANGNAGPNANNRKLGLYKTELCRSWEEKGTCRYGAKCQFAHGEDELRQVQRHPKYKTEICRTFWVSGSCPYGKRCCFIHTELPGTAQPGQDGVPPLSTGEGRPRSDSDPNESTSLLARISAKRQEPTSIKPNPIISTTPPSAGLGGRPGSLRVDTSVLDPIASKQNKSAFPSFTHNGILVHAKDDGPAKSPGPVTAGPDFGRHAAARLDIVGSQRGPRKTFESNVHHSFNSSDEQADLNSSTPTATNQSQFAMSPVEVQPSRATRINGHVRSGSAGNWASATNNRASHLTAYPLSSIPGGELKSNRPWAEFSGSRRAADNWA
ncbi:hypothetical protein BC835DRAFT_67940 [Cytidiella melzeri]|nr:hypothetical protein BC835DRAFT_67940 [Cytidiella melzeri]